MYADLSSPVTVNVTLRDAIVLQSLISGQVKFLEDTILDIGPDHAATDALYVALDNTYSLLVNVTNIVDADKRRQSIVEGH